MADDARGRLWFDADGHLNQSGPVLMSEYLAALQEQLRLFLTRLDACEQNGAGDYRLRDPSAGALRGVHVLWENVTQLAQLAIVATLPGVTADEQDQMDRGGGVLMRRPTPPRNAQPLADALNQLTFAILGTAKGGWVSEIPAPTVAKVRTIAAELEQHRVMWKRSESAPVTIAEAIDRLVEMLERAETLRKRANGLALEAIASVGREAFEADPGAFVGSPLEMNSLILAFQQNARAFVKVAYAHGIEAEPLEKFLRTADPVWVPQAIAVLRRIQAAEHRAGFAALGQKSGAGTGGSAELQGGTALQPKGKPPNKRDWTAYQLVTMMAMNQEDAANLMVRRGMKTTQGGVSKSKSKCDKWIKAGGFMPEEFRLAINMVNGKATPVNPAVIEMGERTDGLTKHQREKQANDDE